MITYDAYEKALILRHGKKVHDCLKNADIAIAGLGGLGSNIAVFLARSGVGHLHLVDFDRVDITNLNRQQYDIDDIGKLKTVALAAHIKRFNPFIKVTYDSILVTENNAPNLFGSYPIVCEAFDKAENKAMLVNTLLTECSNTKIISASGMAGLESSNTIQTRKINKRFYVCGDMQSEISKNLALMAPRVALCAAHQANMVLRILTGNEEI